MAAIGVTVLLSVVAHGLTAAPLAERYGRAHSPAADDAGRSNVP